MINSSSLLENEDIPANKVNMLRSKFVSDKAVFYLLQVTVIIYNYYQIQNVRLITN